MISCEKCGQAWHDLLEMQRSGGAVYSVGLKLTGICGDCGYTWAVNENWSCTEFINAEHKDEKSKVA